MRINKVNNILQVYNKNSGNKIVKPGKTSKTSDDIKISESAMDLQFALQKIKNVEEVRMDKVESIRKQIHSGTYEIDGKKIADKILESINFDKKI